MSNCPDFVHQVQNVECDLKNEWQSVHEGWQDCVAERFNNEVMEPYMQIFKQYLTGDGINGCGLEQLLYQMNQHLQDMDSLTQG